MTNKYLLDTNICAYLFRGKYNVKEKLLEVGLDNCFVSEITVAELMYGAELSNRRERHMAEIEHLLLKIKVLQIKDVISEYAKDKAYLRRNGILIDDFDILIGVTAKVFGMTLVTENLCHLQRIPNVKIENWINRQT